MSMVMKVEQRQDMAQACAGFCDDCTCEDIDSKVVHGSKKSDPFLRALTEVWRVSMFGEKKHGANNWKNATPEGMGLYESAMWRHWIKRRIGETHAEDSKCYHLAHMAWNALMLLEMEIRGCISPDWSDLNDR